MKRAMIYLLCLAALPWLGGCNSIYSNYREIENLLVVRSVGFDREDGGTRFSSRPPQTMTASRYA